MTDQHGSHRNLMRILGSLAEEGFSEQQQSWSPTHHMTDDHEVTWQQHDRAEQEAEVMHGDTSDMQEGEESVAGAHGSKPMLAIAIGQPHKLCCHCIAYPPRPPFVWQV